MSQLTIEQAMKVATEHHSAGRLADAEGIYRQVLAREPRHAEAMRLLGTLACQTGHIAAGIELLRRSLAIAPNNPPAHNNLARALTETGQFAEAERVARRAVELSPRFADAHNNLGVALDKLGRHDEAIVAFHRCLELHPDDADALINLGAALMMRQQPDEAIVQLRRAVQLRPTEPGGHLNLGGALYTTGRCDEAIAVYRAGMDRVPQSSVLHGTLIYTMHFSPSCDASAIRAEQQRFQDRHAKPIAKLALPRRDCDPDRRLRIGYMASEFREHVHGRYLFPLIREHDRSQVEVFCYSDTAADDAMTRKFREMVGPNWRVTLGQSDDALARQIAADKIDVFVDTMLHMRGSRVLVLARRPAPVQATFAGYPGSTGLDAVDYRMTDPVLEPEGGDDGFWSEQPIRLPHTFWCYHADDDDPEPNELPAATAGHVTFGCLNSFAKVNDDLLRRWAAVMTRVERSRLLLLAPLGSARERTLNLMKEFGVASDRIEFSSHVPRRDYLRLHHRVDLALDSFPYNGHTTSLDAMWMGVPVVTLAGTLPVSRGGASQLSNLGLNELIATSAEQFVEIAVALAKDAARLAELRRTLRGRMQRSPLTNAPSFARGIEDAYRTMWRRYCANPR